MKRVLQEALKNKDGRKYALMRNTKRGYFSLVFHRDNILKLVKELGDEEVEQSWTALNQYAILNISGN